VNSSGIDLVAGSGGSSSIYTGALKPTWQAGLGDANRDIPDVSLFSSDGQNKSFYIVCEADQDITGDTGCSLTKFTSTAPFHDFQAIGGTSAATPTFAGIVALVNQKTSQRQGNVNYVLYALGKSENFANCNSSSFTNPAVPPPATCVFQDITKGNVSVACAGGSPNCSNTTSGQFGVMATTKGGTTPAFGTAPGYDLATGLGSVNVANLLTAWASPSRTGSTTMLVLLAGPFTVDGSVAVNGTVAPGTATGIVSLFQGSSSTGKVIDRFTVAAGGTYSGNTTMLPGGSYSVIAHYGGDGTFAASDSAPIAVTVAPSTSQTVVNLVTFNGNTPLLSTSAQTLAYGSAYILRVDVKNAGGQTCENLPSTTFFPTTAFVCPTGTVALKDNGLVLLDFPSAQNANASNIANLTDRGFAEDQPIQLPPGSHSIAASYSGDPSYNASSSNTLSVTITKATTTAAVTSNVTTITSGGSVTLTATISTNSNGAGPTGTVQFKNGSSNLGSTVNCTPTSGIASTTGNASCTATLTTALSQFVPMTRPQPGPRIWMVPLWIAAGLAILFLILAQHAARLQRKWTRLGYAAAGLLLFAWLAAGIAGCSGRGGGGGGRTDSITAVYGGDANYTGSTSPATAITVQ